MNLIAKSEQEISGFFPNYYKASEMEFGNHGPEKINNEYYMSVYHFLQLNEVDPREYNTFTYGNHMMQLCSEYTSCKYVAHSFIIHKYPYSELLQHQNIIKEHLN